MPFMELIPLNFGHSNSFLIWHSAMHQGPWKCFWCSFLICGPRTLYIPEADASCYHSLLSPTPLVIVISVSMGSNPQGTHTYPPPQNPAINNNMSQYGVPVTMPLSPLTVPMSMWTSCSNLQHVLVYCQGMFHDLQSPSDTWVGVSPIPTFFPLHHWALQCHHHNGHKWVVCRHGSPSLDHFDCNPCFYCVFLVTASIGNSLPWGNFATLTSNLPCRHASALMQLRTGHVPLNHHLAHIKKVESPTCPKCNANFETIQHYILVCPVYRAARWLLEWKVRQQQMQLEYLLTNAKSIPNLFFFLSNTKRLQQVFGNLMPPMQMHPDPPRRVTEG